MSAKVIVRVEDSGKAEVAVSGYPKDVLLALCVAVQRFADEVGYDVVDVADDITTILKRKKDFDAMEGQKNEKN